MTTIPATTNTDKTTSLDMPAGYRWWLHPLDWAGLLQARIWADSDAEAEAFGWEVVELHGGWSRQYRDPRLAELLAARRTADRASSAGLHGRQHPAGPPSGGGLR